MRPKGLQFHAQAVGVGVQGGLGRVVGGAKGERHDGSDAADVDNHGLVVGRGSGDQQVGKDLVDAHDAKYIDVEDALDGGLDLEVGGGPRHRLASVVDQHI